MRLVRSDSRSAFPACLMSRMTSLPIGQRVEQAMFQRLNPQLTLSREAEENQLVNQGFQRGTDAFRNAMDQHRTAGK